MESRVEEAVRLFESGYGCSQAVFSTYADLLGMDKKLALRLASPMGAGIGRMREVCGTISAMALLEGLKEGNDDASDAKAKAANYEKVRQMSDTFTEMNGSIICRELIGLAGRKREESAMPKERTETYYKERPCTKLVRSAAMIVETQLLPEMFADA